jgi:hypothetical protein
MFKVVHDHNSLLDFDQFYHLPIPEHPADRADQSPLSQQALSHSQSHCIFFSILVQIFLPTALLYRPLSSAFHSLETSHSPSDLDTPTTPFALNRVLTSCHRQSPAISIFEVSTTDPNQTTGTSVFVAVDRSLQVLGMQVP